jgi:beta-glucosidase
MKPGHIAATFFAALLAGLFTPRLFAAQNPEHPWFDTGLSHEQRIDSLLGAMTLDEKMAQLMDDAPAIPRLGIPAYHWWNEALHGVARNGRATVFPQAIGMAATFDDALLERVATAISDEARAKFRIAQELGNTGKYAGLTFWSPNINIFRDPRWGRGMETYGEDPYLMARMGTAFVRGIQGDDADYLKAAACAKHYAVHSGPEALRHEFDAVPPRRDYHETYLPAFEALVKAGVECVMCAYNRVDGAPACGSDELLGGILREDWGFQGHVVSDCGAVSDFHSHHKVTRDAAESAAWALKSGTDVNCGRTYAALPEALSRGLVEEQHVDRALARLLRTRLKLGLLDPPDANPWSGLGADRVEHPDHVALAREAARRSLVLLKNANGVLPLQKNLRSLYVTGPMASSTEVLIGNYYGLSRETVSILDGIVGKVSVGTTVTYTYGQLPFRENVNPIDWATGTARTADATIVVLGISGLLEGEEGESVASPTRGDRLDIRLPEAQLAFLRKMATDNDKPIVVVMTGGSPIAIPEVHELADAVLWAWYPGQQGGNAVADVLFGDASPSGRLPITFPRSVEQLPPYEDYSMQGRTYRYMTEEPLYPFGYGLAYTTFEYGEPGLEGRPRAGEPLRVSVTVTNTGAVAGTEVVQLYVRSEEAGFDVPLASLADFRAVRLERGESKTLAFDVTPERLQVYDAEGRAQFASGRHTLFVGGVSPGSRGEALTGQAIKRLSFELEP